MPRKTKELEKTDSLNSVTEKKTKNTTKTNKKKSEVKTPKKTSSKSSTHTNKKTTKKPVSTVKNKNSTKNLSTKVKNTKSINKTDFVEYYDLPYSYNQTTVKVLAQTPTNLFIYWDISDADKETYKKQYGDNFFETTKPVLIVHNDTLNYSFEVEINDFANSWYLHVNDAKCDYRIELGRRIIAKIPDIETDYIYISMSNEIEAPNNKILFDNKQQMVYFKNVKNNTQTSKSIFNLSFIKNMGKIYNIYDIYKKIYKDENIKDKYDLSNPSS